MKINPTLSINKQEQQIEKIKEDSEKAGEIFEKILLQQMMEGMYKTATYDQESSVEKDFYQEQIMDILSDKIVESKKLNIREKLFPQGE